MPNTRHELFDLLQQDVFTDVPEYASRVRRIRELVRALTEPKEFVLVSNLDGNIERSLHGYTYEEALNDAMGELGYGVVTREEAEEDLEGEAKGEEILYRSYYEHCGTKWESVWPSACDDECPICGKPITPYDTEQEEPAHA